MSLFSLTQPYYAGSWVVTLLSANLGLGATFTHLLIWNYSDIKGAWSWMSLSSLKMMYQNFNWRFWTDDGMRKQVGDDDGTGELESDPHYREMLKVKELLLLLILFLGPNRSFFFYPLVPRCSK